jgi:hypothetical protein
MTVRTTFRTRPRTTPPTGIVERLLVLAPIDVLSEIIFSVLILLTFTLAFRIFTIGANSNEPLPAAYITELLVGALGATVAWGLIDGVMYALMSVFERGEKHRLLMRVQAATSEGEGIEAIAEELDFVLEPITGHAKRQLIYADVFEHLRDSKPRPVTFTREELLAAIACVVVAVVAVLPSLTPLLLLRHDYLLAVRLSNLISFGVLFIAGYQWGKYSGMHPLKTGFLLFVIGVVLVALAIPLGG